MRKSNILAIVALALIPTAASAQQTPAATTSGTAGVAATSQPAAGPAPAAQADAAVEEYVPRPRNVFDVGFRGSSVTGDSARYERYRDMGDGLFLEGFALSRQTKNSWFLDAGGQHVGRRDQSFFGSIVRPGRVKIEFGWDQVPTLLSRTTQSLFAATSPNVLTIDDGLQTAAQASTANLRNLFPTYERGFDLRSRRHIGSGKMELFATPDLVFKLSVSRMNRSGTIPYLGSFGHGNFIETTAPVNHTLTATDGGAEFLRGPVLVRAGYTASLFNNEYTTLTFDSPWRAVDISGTSSRGRASLPPSNSFYGVNGLASVKFAGRSRVTAYLSTGVLKDAGAPLMDQTINSAVTGVQALPRTAVDGKARTTSMNLTFSSRPSRYVDFKVKFRSYNYDNQTPQFVMQQRVPYDNAAGAATYSSIGGIASAVGTVVSEAFGVKRENFDADFGVTPTSGTSASVGYSRIVEDRAHRVIEATHENIFRVTFDQVGNQWFSLRAKFEQGKKRGEIGEEGIHELWLIGEQPGIRQFDIASRDRTRGTLLGIVNLGGSASINASLAAGTDDYIESQFGLRDNTNKIYGVGFDLAPAETVTLGLTYSFERYTTLQRSRTASPPSGAAVITYEQYQALTALPSTTVQVADASRNWANQGLDRVHTVVASAEFAKIANKVDLRFAVDLSRARTMFDYLLGPVALLPGESSVTTSLATPAPLPTNETNFGRSTVDVTYALTARLGIGVSYWHEQYRVKDFSLGEEAITRPDITRNAAGDPTAFLSGSWYRPYTANTVWGRLMYRW